MKVLKFGGTSVGTVESLAHVKEIVEGIKEPTIVVVSALGGITDKLILTAKKASNADLSFREDLSEIRNRHYGVIEKVVPEDKKASVNQKVDYLFSRLERILSGVELIEMLPEQILATLVSFGERISSEIVAAMIDGGERHDSLNFIKTEKWHGKNIASTSLINQLVKEEFSKGFNKAIIPGFISKDKESGEITNLGRGGSDYTAALIAAALNADVLEIWTDVDGFMTADPRIVRDAAVIPMLSFSESMELCTFGAKVVYPPTIYPVFHKNIPIKILNTFNKTAPGTLITDNTDNQDFPFKGVTALRATALFSLKRLSLENDASFKNRALNILSKNGIRLFSLVNDESLSSFSFAVSSADISETEQLLVSEFAPEISNGEIIGPELKDNLSIVAIVGSDMSLNSRLAARIKNTLNREGIEVEVMSIGNSDTTMTFMVDSNLTEKVLILCHNLLFN